jgi:hypothetical protein
MSSILIELTYASKLHKIGDSVNREGCDVTNRRNGDGRIMVLVALKT